MKRDRISHERLLEVLDYDPDTGIFTWKYGEEKHLKGLAGKRAGTFYGDYVIIGVDGCYTGAHRLAWLYMTGSFSKKQIDHINGNPSDNRFANLREATHAENVRNTKVQRNNRSGIHGVGMNKGRWRARVMVNGKTHAKFFKTKDEAVASVIEMRKQLHGEFARIPEELINATEGSRV